MASDIDGNSQEMAVFSLLLDISCEKCTSADVVEIRAKRADNETLKPNLARSDHSTSDLNLWDCHW